MRIEFTEESIRSLFQTYSLQEDKKYLAEDCLQELLTSTNKDWHDPSTRACFASACDRFSKPEQKDGYAKFLTITCDFLYWYQAQNMFHEFLVAAGLEESEALLQVLLALKQLVAKSVNIEYFALTDSLMRVVARFWGAPAEIRNWRVLAEVFAVLDEVQEAVNEQKATLRFIKNLDLCLNLDLFAVSSKMNDVMNLVLKHFSKSLHWLLTDPSDPTRPDIEHTLTSQFQIPAVTPAFVEFMFQAFKTLLRDRAYGYTFAVDQFFNEVPCAQTIADLVCLVKNEGDRFTLEQVMNGLQVLDGLSCVDLIKEFQGVDEKKNPYFKEACKYFNFYASLLRSLAQANQHPDKGGDVQMTTQNQLRSQKFLFAYLLFLQDLVELKTREMQTQLFPQIVEPLACIITQKPSEGLYHVDLVCQEAAQQVLKSITKRSHVSDDAQVLSQVIERLKVELLILREDLSGNPSRWKNNKPLNDLDFCSHTLDYRQKLIKSLIGFLCYSIIRVDPANLGAQNSNFVPNSRKICDSKLFEELLQDLIFERNGPEAGPLYEKVIEPIFAECVQLYTYIGNDLPQHLGDLIDNTPIMTTILNSLSRRVPVVPNIFNVSVKFFKMLCLNAKGTAALLESQAIESLFGIGLNQKSYRAVVTRSKSQAMFDYQQLVHSFANEHQEIADRVYRRCLSNLDELYRRSWQLTSKYLEMDRNIQAAGAETEEQKLPHKNEYLKEQIKFGHAMESSCALLFYFCMDELEYIEDNYTSCVIEAIKKTPAPGLYNILRQPTICSLADGFIFNFLEAVSFIMFLQRGVDGFKEYLQKLLVFTQEDFSDLKQILGTNDLNSLNRLEAAHFVDLCEPAASQEQRESHRQLKLSVILYLSIAKIHILVEILNIIQVFIRNYDRAGLFPVYQTFTEQLQVQETGGLKCFYQLHALLSRHYASEINVQLAQDEAKAARLISKYSASLDKYIWKSFQESLIPLNELEEARNLYFRYRVRVVDSLGDRRADDLVRQHFDFVLPDSESVINTIKCHKKIKGFMNQLSAICNKRRNQADYDHFQIQNNQINAHLFADQVRIIAARCQGSAFNKETVISTAICIEILSEVSRPLMTKERKRVFGVFLLNLLNQHDIVKPIGAILEWAIQQYEAYDAMQGPKELFYARNLQQIVNDCVQFFWAVLKVTYLWCGDNQSYLSAKQVNQSFLCYFIKNHQFALGPNYAEALTRLKNLLFVKALIPISELLFSQKHKCFGSWHRFRGVINEQVIKIYASVCSGGFEPQDFFKNQLSQAARDRFGTAGLLTNRERNSALIRVSNELVVQLTEMGFKENVVRAALRFYANNLELALEGLLRNEFQDAADVAEQDQNQDLESEMEKAVVDKLNQNKAALMAPESLLFTEEFGQDVEPQIHKQILSTIRETFVPCLTECFSNVPVHLQRLLIVKLFAFYKENLESPEKGLYQLVSDIFSQLAAQAAVPEWFLSNFFMQILQYAKEDFASQNFTHLFLTLIAKLHSKITDMAALLRTTSLSSETLLTAADEQQVEKVNLCLYNIHCQMSLLYYLVTDFTAQQEIDQLHKLTASSDEQQSAFEEQTVTFKDLEIIRSDSLFWPTSTTKKPVSLIESIADRQAIVKALYQCVIETLRNFTNLPGTLYTHIEEAAMGLFSPVFKILKQISGLQLPDFEFRQAFMRDNGFRLIFEMHVSDSRWDVKRMKTEQKEAMQTDLVELLENVSHTARDLQNQYENVIQRQMFFQFKANFKRKCEDGSIQRDLNDYIIAGVDPQPDSNTTEAAEQQPTPASMTKVKRQGSSTAYQPAKKSKSLGKQAVQEEPVVELPSVKDVKRLVKKYEELNEQNFSDFMRYYNSNDFSHVITNLGVFLQACAKVCVIKKVPKKPDAQHEEAKDCQPQFEIKIMLKKQILKDLLTDLNFNYALPTRAAPRLSQKLETPRCMQEILNQLLEMFIFQHKGYRMELLRQLREPRLSSESTSLVQLVEGRLCVRKDREVERRIYFFDHLVILRLITFMIAKSKICTGLQSVILKHNDSKTIKFIFRNIYFMLALSVAENSRELCLNPSPDRSHIIVFFLSSILLDTPGRSVQSKQCVFQELAAMFCRQVCRGLAQTVCGEGPWPTTVALLQKYQSIWLIQHFLTMRTTESLSAIKQKKIKFQRLQRTHMMKQIILLFQQQTNPVFQEQPSFALLEAIQSAASLLKTQDLLIIQDMKTKYLSSCVIVITKVLRLFENSQSLGKYFAELGERRSASNDQPSELPSPGDQGSQDYFDESDEEGEDEMSNAHDSQGSEDSDSDFPSEQGQNREGYVLDDYMEDIEEEMSEGSWDFSEQAEEELIEEIIEQASNSQQINTSAKAGPPPPQSDEGNDNYSGYSFGGENDERSDSPSDEVSWDENPHADLQADQVSFVHSQREDSYSQNADDYDDDSEQSDSFDQNQSFQGDEEDEGHSELGYDAYQELQQQARGERAGGFIVRQSVQHQMQRHHLHLPPEPSNLITQHDHFNLEANTVNGQRPGLFPTVSFRNLMEQPLIQDAHIFQILSQGRPDSSQQSAFVAAVIERKDKIKQLRDTMKQTQGLYLMQISTFVSGNAQVPSAPKNNSVTADSSDVFKHNPDDYKSHMQSAAPQVSQPVPRQQQKNPLEIEGMDPLFMESLSPIGLQNIADAHRMQAQVSQQANQFSHNFSLLFQDVRDFIRGSSQQRRQDILRQLQSGQCRDIPADLYQEAREFYRVNRDELLRLFNNNASGQSNQTQVQQFFSNLRSQQNRVSEQEIPPQRDRLVSQDSVTISLDIRGPGDSHTVLANTLQPGNRRIVEQIRGDQFIQNFFIVLQDINSCFEREPSVVATDKQAEQILSASLIPQQHESPATQFQKIRSMVETAVITFMNLDLQTDSQLVSSIKILHRIPNIRVCLILSMLKLSQDEISNARKHCQALEGLPATQRTPYQNKIIFADRSKEDQLLSFANTVVSTVKSVQKLQFTIEPLPDNELYMTKVMEIVHPVQKDSLIDKFAQLIGLQAYENKPIFLVLLQLCLDFQALHEEFPWVLPLSVEGLLSEVQDNMIFHINQITNQFQYRTSALADIPLFVSLMSRLFLDRKSPLPYNTIETVSAGLAVCCDTKEGQLALQAQFEERISRSIQAILALLASPSCQLEELQTQVKRVMELVKVVSGMVDFKNVNICIEALLLALYEAAEKVLYQEQRRIETETQTESKYSMFVFREDVRELLLLLFTLGEYNLRRYFAQKTEQRGTSSTQTRVQTLDRQSLQTDKAESKEVSVESLMAQQEVKASDGDFKRIKGVLGFFVGYRLLINKFIQMNSGLVNKQLIQVAMMLPQVLDFSTKRVVWRTELKRLQQKYKNERFSFAVKRETTFQDSYSALSALSQKQWRGPMTVEFTGEDGIDEGGLFKEWLSNMSKEIFNEDMALFVKSHSGSTYYPNPKSVVQPDFVAMFCFVGRIFGKALWDFQLVDCYFVKAFYKLLLGMPLSYHDLEDYDSTLYNSLNWMIQNPGADLLCRDFVETVDYFGEQKEVELIPGGKDIAVTDDNKCEYVQQVATFRLHKQVQPQIEAFLKGFYSVIPRELLRIFDSNELELLIAGLQQIDVDDLREHTLYQGYTATSKPVVFLFEALREFDNAERAEFIRFVTGSSKVPVEGFRGLRGQNGVQKFTVYRIPSTTQTRLPQSHTCHNQLDLPEYKDKETTKRMLLMAIKEGKTFGLA